MSVHAPVLPEIREPAGQSYEHTAAEADVPQHRPAVTISPVVIGKALLFIVAILVCIGTIADILIFRVFDGREHKMSRLLNRVDLGFEPSLPAFYSAVALLAASGLLAFIAFAEKREAGRHVRHWGVLSFLFFGMALDEAILLHEMFVDTLRNAFDLHGVLYFSWVIPGALTVLIVGCSYLKFLLRLDRRTRNLFIAAAVLFVGGALGMEMVAGVLVESHGNGVEEAGLAAPSHIAVQTIEESGEMLGIVLFIYALLCYIETRWGRLQLTTSPRPSADSAAA